jgi:homoserine kinase type II
MQPEASGAASRLAAAVSLRYGREALSIVRIHKGMGTTNWRVRTPTEEYFLKQYPPNADIAGEAVALEMSQLARAAGVPAPLVIPSRGGELLWSDGDLAFTLFEYLPDTTSGVALSRAQMVQAGAVLGRVHQSLRPVRSTFPDIAEEWLALDEGEKRAEMERYLWTIARREEQDDFDRRTVVYLQRRLELIPRAGALLRSLPPLTRQVVHGDYSVWNILFRGDELVAVVDFRPPEPFLPAFEIGRAALNPETVTAGPWLEEALDFVEGYCRSNPDIALADVRFAPHVWAIQLVRSEYGVRQHYFRPLEQQADLDRFWFQRCETAEVILDNLDEISERFVTAWENRDRS